MAIAMIRRLNRCPDFISAGRQGERGCHLMPLDSSLLMGEEMGSPIVAAMIRDEDAARSATG
ncbi:hypothetical protein ACLOJK_021991 [Asimina triloba]